MPECVGCRVGIGTDSHRFVAAGQGRPLVLGGVIFPGEPGLEANSDGDVILHALYNAIAQALGERSLGHVADPLCAAGVTDSAAYLQVIRPLMNERGYRLGNIGIMIEGRRPRFAGHEERMRDRIAAIMGIDSSQVGITATSGEGLTDFGRGLGLQCLCTVMLRGRATA